MPRGRSSYSGTPMTVRLRSQTIAPNGVLNNQTEPKKVGLKTPQKEQKSNMDNITANGEPNTVKLATVAISDAVHLPYQIKDDIFESDFSGAVRKENSKSPASVDSAKGSSLLTNSLPNTYVSGDIFWAQVHAYCYWPAIVAPDFGGHTTSNQVITNDIIVHVVFFENTARSAWVTEENLLPFISLYKYGQLQQDALHIYGKNSHRYKCFVPKPHQRRAWRDAIEDADAIMRIPLTQRLKAFFANVEKNRILRIQERKLKLPQRLISNRGSIDSLLSPAVAKKRDRSQSPTASSAVTPRRLKISRTSVTPLKSESIIMQSDNRRRRDSMRLVKSAGSNRVVNRRLTIAISLNSDQAKLPGTSPSQSPQSLVQPSAALTNNHKMETKRPIKEVIEDILDLDNKYLFVGLTRDPICKYCFHTDTNLKKCPGGCLTYFHTNCMKIPLVQIRNQPKIPKRSILGTNATTNESKNMRRRLTIAAMPSVSNATRPKTKEVDTSEESICKECASQQTPACKACQKADKAEELLSCTMPNCHYKFHESCCNSWPQAKIFKSKNNTSFRCPCHVCHHCVSDNPKFTFQKLTNAKTTRCIKCPATYDTDSNCIPAGAIIINAAHIICPRHLHEQPANVNFCCSCGEGGELICCDTCTSAIHMKCLPTSIDITSDYICDDCDAGRLPRYGDMIWAKFNNFRWWPGIILPPTEIPDNINRMPHNPFEFVVRFMGTHDHGWVSYRRVHDYGSFNDRGKMKSAKSGIDMNFIRAAKEAEELYERILEQQKARGIVNKGAKRMLPQPYKKIKANRGVPKNRLENPNICFCTKDLEHPCGPDSLCINRNLKQECHPALCPAGDRCENQMLETKKSPKLELIHTADRGFGLVCREPITAGSFVIEYVGEIITDAELQARINQKSEDRDENYYFFFINKNHIIDAGPMGNLSRFINHSCDPNCETDKWLVNGVTRVAIFAKKDIPQDTELTFNYNWDDLVGTRKKECHCGSSKCSGQIGAKQKLKRRTFFQLRIQIDAEKSKKGTKNSK